MTLSRLRSKDQRVPIKSNLAKLSQTLGCYAWPFHLDLLSIVPLLQSEKNAISNVDRPIFQILQFSQEVASSRSSTFERIFRNF